MTPGLYFLAYTMFAVSSGGSVIQGPVPLPIGPFQSSAACAAARAQVLIAPTLSNKPPTGSNLDSGVSNCFTVGGQ